MDTLGEIPSAVALADEADADSTATDQLAEEIEREAGSAQDENPAFEDGPNGDPLPADEEGEQ